MRVLRIFGIVAAACVALVIMALGGMLLFGKAKDPALITGFGDQFRGVDYSDLPPLEYYRARDGVELAYRTYLAPTTGTRPQEVAVLVHGATDSSAGMHAVAKTLAQEGITSFVPDLRGHGANQPHGDIRYPGQLDDDLIDLVRQMRPKHPRAQWTLVGFSAGGGFALRVDGGPQGDLFDRYLLLAPGLRYDAPTSRPLSTSAAQRFVAPYTGRLIAVSVLHGVGVHWFDNLPVLAFAVPVDSERFTARYSTRLLENFSPHQDYLADIRSIHKPTVVLVGTNDEFILAERVEPVFHGQRKDVAITILPGLNHLDLVTNPEAMRAITAAMR
jgi:alpha-beta hydrolase superfamily lysophospholipase